MRRSCGRQFRVGKCQTSDQSCDRCLRLALTLYDASIIRAPAVDKVT